MGHMEIPPSLPRIVLIDDLEADGHLFVFFGLFLFDLYGAESWLFSLLRRFKAKMEFVLFCDHQTYTPACRLELGRILDLCVQHHQYAALAFFESEGMGKGADNNIRFVEFFQRGQSP